MALSYVGKYENVGAYLSSVNYFVVHIGHVSLHIYLLFGLNIAVRQNF